MKRLIFLFVLICSIATYGQDLTCSQEDSIIRNNVGNYLNRQLGERFVTENIRIISIGLFYPEICAICEVKTKDGIKLNDEGRNSFVVKLNQYVVDTLHTFLDKDEIDKCISGKNCKLLIGKDKAIEIAKKLKFKDGLV